MTTAEEMVQAWLDTHSQSLVSDDFERYADLVVLPLVVVTRSAVISVDDEAKLRLGFDAWRSMLRNQRVTDTIYTVRDVTELDASLVSAQYVTRLLRDATPICAPFSTQMVFRRFEDSNLRAVTLTMGLNNLSWPFTVPRVGGGGEPLDWTPDNLKS